jgi:hypothetical protein
MFFDPVTRVLLRTRPSPLTPADVARLGGDRPAGPPPQPSVEPVRVQRRVSVTGVIMVAGQKVALGGGMLRDIAADARRGALAVGRDFQLGSR